MSYFFEATVKLILKLFLHAFLEGANPQRNKLVDSPLRENLNDLWASLIALCKTIAVKNSTD